MPARLLRIAVQKLAPTSRQTASSTARSSERVAVARDQRRQAELAAGAQLVAVVVGEQVERGRRRRRRGRRRRRSRSTCAAGRWFCASLRPGSCRTTSRRASRRHSRSPRGRRRGARCTRTNACMPSVTVMTPKRNGMRRRNGCSNASTPSTLTLGAKDGTVGDSHAPILRCNRPRAAQPSQRSQVGGDEGVVGEVGVLAADAVDLLAPGPGSGPRPDRGTRCLRAGPAGAAPRGSRRCSRGSRWRRRRRRCCSR